MTTYRITIRREVEQTHDLEIEAENEDDARDQAGGRSTTSPKTSGTMARPPQMQRSPRSSNSRNPATRSKKPRTTMARGRGRHDDG